MAQPPQPPDWDPRLQRPRRRGEQESRLDYTLRRIGVAILTLVGVTIVTFILFRVLAT